MRVSAPAHKLLLSTFAESTVFGRVLRLDEVCMPRAQRCGLQITCSILVRGVWYIGHCVALNSPRLSVCDAKDADAYAKAASMVEDLLTSLLLARSHSSSALRNN